MLVTDGGGAQVVLCASKIGRNLHLATRAPDTGNLRILSPDDAIAHQIVAVPELLAVAKQMLEFAQQGSFKYPPGSLSDLYLAVEKAEGRP